MNQESWRLSHIWNAVAMKENKPLVKRDYIYASEIGAPYCDRFLKMQATPYTNPPNNRSLRKFLAGNLMEYVVKQILISAGIYRRDEIKADCAPYEGALEVHGRYDFLAGGYIECEQAKESLSRLVLPEPLYAIGEKIIDGLCNRPLQEKILELKAVSTFAMDRVETAGAAIPQHTLQGYHYKRHTGIHSAIVYVCKDDCRMAEFDVDTEATEPLYRQDVEEMSSFFKAGEMPPNAPLVRFDWAVGKFSKNLHVEYSPYLTLLYGFKDPDAYREAVAYVDKWNRTLSRYAMAATGGTTPTGKPITITSKNKEVLWQIEDAGYKTDELINCKIAMGAIEEEEVEA